MNCFVLAQRKKKKSIKKLGKDYREEIGINSKKLNDFLVKNDKEIKV